MKFNNKIFIQILFASYFIQSILSSKITPVKDQNNINISFGSCNKYERHQPGNIFYNIADLNPDAFIWLGDAAYLDHYWLPHCCLWWVSEEDMDEVDRIFGLTKNDPGYQSLLNTQTPIFGVYDDHDYNQNDGGKNNPMKDIIKQKYLTFLDEPQNSKRWNANTLYDSFYVGDKKQVKVILLDVRSDRDDNLSEQQVDYIGSEQWDLLEQDLIHDNLSEITIIGSGSVFIQDDKFLIEHWYWPSKLKLFKLLQKSRKRVLLISGDIHYAEFTEHPCSTQEYGFQMHEFTSSGLSFSEIEFPFVDQLKDIWVTDNYNQVQDRYYGINFGNINVQLNQEDIDLSVVTLQIYGLDGLQKEKNIQFKNLNHNENLIQKNKQCHLKQGEEKYRLFMNLFLRAYQGYPIAFLFIGLLALILIIIFKIFKQIIFSKPLIKAKTL